MSVNIFQKWFGVVYGGLGWFAVVWGCLGWFAVVWGNSTVPQPGALKHYLDYDSVFIVSQFYSFIGK